MSEETPGVAPAAGRGIRAGWAAVAAGVILAACLCGFAVGSVMVSAGVSAYSGWSGVAVTRLIVTVAFVSGPTYTPQPTYTLQPTYTPQPTHTPQPTYTFAPTPPPDVFVQPTQASAPTQAADVTPSQDVIYDVAEGDTLESILDQFGADIVPLIVANNLDPDTPTVQAGQTITIPYQVAPLCLPERDPAEADVIGVFDGDTIEVSLGGQNYTVRYLGIDAPALEPTPEEFSGEAQVENQTLVDGLTVNLVEDTSQTDDAGRLLRYVVVGDTFVNYELVRRGFARAAPTPPDTACSELFALAEAQARKEGLGLWASQSPDAQATPGGPPPATPTPSGPPPPAGATPTGPYPSIQPAAWTPPPSLTPTSTSSLGFNCQCRGQWIWGNFQNQAQADACSAICAIAATRRAARWICDPENGDFLGCNP